MKNFLIIFLMGVCFTSNAQFTSTNLNSEAVVKALTVCTQDNAGSMVLAGQFLNTLTIGGTTLTNSYPDNSNLYGIGMNGNNPFVAKRNPNGSFAWVKKITLNANASKPGCTTPLSGALIHGICTDANDNIFITGIFRGSVNFDGYNIVSLTYKTGACSDFSADIFTAKISPAGMVLWVKKEGTNSIYRESGNSVAADAAGNVVMTGIYFQKAINGTTCNGGSWGGNGATAKMYFYVVKYDPNGTKVWEKKFAGDSYDCERSLEGKSIVSDGTNYYLAGFILGTTAFDTWSLSSGGINSTAIIKLNAGGSVVWAQSFSGAENKPWNLLIDGSGSDLFIAGNSQAGTVDFGNSQSLVATASNTSYLVKCSAATGICQWAIAPGSFATVSGSGAAPRSGHRLFFFPNHNIGTPSRDASNNFMINEFSSASGALVNSTVATNTIAGSANLISDIIGTPDGYAYVLSLRGGYDLGGTTIESTQPVNSSFADFMLVRYSGTGFRLSAREGDNKGGLICYPNPVQGMLNLQEKEGQEIGEIWLLDPAGRTVYRETISSSQAHIDMQKLAPGIYILKREHCNLRIIKDNTDRYTR